MKKQTLPMTVIAACLFAATVSPVSAATYTANFSTPQLDPSLSFTGGTGYSISTGGGLLTLNYDIPSSAMPVTINPSVYTKFDLLGDYTAKVTVDFAGQPSDNGDGAGAPAFVAHDGASDYNVIGADTNANGSYVSGFQSLSGIGSSTGFANTGDMLTLQFQRIGQTLIESYAPAGSSSFQTLSDINDPTYGGPASFTLSSFYNGSDGAKGQLVFSDFTITTPSVAAVPEASSWIMMILGFGAIGGMMRRAHRKSEERFTRKVRSLATA